ncbi:hypothetical protein M8C21_011481, partial [Ambrosia artemisiifolia]
RNPSFPLFSLVNLGTRFAINVAVSFSSSLSLTSLPILFIFSTTLLSSSSTLLYDVVSSSSMTKLYQRTRSGYEKLYLEYSQKKNNGRRRNGGGGGGSGGVSVRESDGDRVGGENSKEKSSRKSSEVLQGSDGGRNVINAVARRTRQALRGKKKPEIVSTKGKNSREVYLIVDSDDDGDGDDDGLQNHVKSEVEEASESEEIEEVLQRGSSRNRGKNVSKKSGVDELHDDLSNRCGKNQGMINAKGISLTGKSKKECRSSRTKDLKENDAAADDDALSYPGDSLKRKGGFGDEFDKDTKDSSLSSSGFPLSSGFQLSQSDDDEIEGVVYLGDDPACLDDCDRSHSSRVESNEVKVSPVEMDSIQADAEAKEQGLKSSQEEDDDPQKVVSPEEDGRDWGDKDPIENNAAAHDKEAICLSSSSDDDDNDNDDLVDKFWEKLLQLPPCNKGHEEVDGREPRIFNPKPVCEPKKKTETVVSKKRCGSSNELRQPVKEGSKKRRTDADSLHGFARNNNKGVEDTFWQVVDEKGPPKVGMSTSKKDDLFGSKINVVKIFTDAIREGDGDNVLKRYSDILPEDSSDEKTEVDEVLSYKFKFEDEEDIKPEKLESEMEVDGLFDEMNMCLQISEIGSSDTRGVRCGNSGFLDGIDQVTRCRRGQHELSINDEFGIVCRYCTYVEMEIRDILPPLGEKYIRQVEKSHLSELVFSSKNKDSSHPTISSTVSKDKILEEMVNHEKLRNMFEKVIYQPKEADLIETFGCERKHDVGVIVIQHQSRLMNN